MELNSRLYDLFAEKAKQVKVEMLILGLGYTAVTTSDQGIGISYTYFQNKVTCTLNHNYCDYEGQPAIELLEKIKSSDPIQRSMALALVNALNYENALLLPQDPGNKILFEKFAIGKGTKVAMVGFFGPMMKIFSEKGAVVEVKDEFQGLGKKGDFDEKLSNWADVLFLTSTSVLNSTTEDILKNVGKNVRTVMLGPSTPMVKEAFEHLPVQMLAGTVPVDKDKVLKAVRHGTGTPVIQKFSRKSFLSFF